MSVPAVRIGLIAAVAAMALPTPSSARAARIVDVPVTFNVVNKNDSQVPCQSDGLPYQVVGDLVAPRALLEAGLLDSVTVYVHGSGNGSFWHFKAVPGLDYAAEMATLGHASLVIDLLGYGRSDIPEGTAICFGSQADVLHQVIGKLRVGDYDFGPRMAPSFAAVALAGHSLGGWISEVEAYSFRDIDALVVAGWVDHPANPVVVEAGARHGLTCAQGGERKFGDKGPGGYAFTFNEQEIRELAFFNAEGGAIGAYVEAFERDFCLASSAGQAELANQLLIPSIAVPTLLVYGDRDLYRTPLPELQAARYQGSDDVTLKIIENAGHSLTLQRTAREFRAVMSDWLSTRGF